MLHPPAHSFARSFAISLAFAFALAGCAASVGPADGRADDASADVPRSCPLPDGGTCPVGSTCPAGDGCNVCMCSASGALACTLIGCTLPDVTVACASSAQCRPGQRCAYPQGCSPDAMGRCVDAAECDRLPVSMPYCGCDGTTFDPGACPPDRPFAAMGQCAASDGGAESVRYPGAIMAWQAPGGFAGTGPAVVVTADGQVRIYTAASGFDPAGPLPSPSRVVRVSIAEVDDLFTRWFRTPTPGLPHMNPGGGECYPSVFTRLCGSCTPRSIDYHTPADLLPEMDGVWNWFDTHTPDVSPRHFCG